VGRSAPNAALAGGVAMVFALLVAYLASVAGIPFAPVALGQAIIEVLPGWLSVPLIELLQFWAQRLLVIGVVAGFLAAGTIAGAFLASRRGTTAVVAIGAAPWVGAFALGQIFAPLTIDLSASLFDAALGAAAFFGALAWLASAERVSDPALARGRRRVLLGAMSGAAVLTAISLGLGSAGRAVGTKAARVVATARRLRAKAFVPPADPAFDALERLTGRITANPDHYTVDTALIDPRIVQATWRLEIGGAVEHPFVITYEELLDMEAVEQAHTLECISNEIGGDLISTAIWTGVPMRDLLERARPRADAFDVVLRSVDGYSDSVRIAKAMEPGTLVAYLMNGYELPEEHGFPARALIPNIYGMKNVKWLGRIEVATHDYQGYWMERGWSDIAVYNVHSRIDLPRGEVRWAGGTVPIAGIAFAGSRGVSRVEVSADGGRTWTDARLETAIGGHTWRRWRHEWTPSGTGKHRVVARATDGDGLTETPTRRPPFPSGATGHDSVEVTVTRG